MADVSNPLDEARRALDMSVSDLWWRYFAVGGMGSELEVEAVLFGALVPNDLMRDHLAVALNERFFELGRDHPIPYSDDKGDGDDQSPVEDIQPTAPT